jgi:glycine/D-amino acid oxidase-like deaminating enzyme
MKVAIVGGGIAGALLAWRLTRYAGLAIEVFPGGRPAPADATGASGGLVRAYEPDPRACQVAAESLAELLGSATLRDLSGYREVGSVYLACPAADPAGALATIADLVPGSAVAASRAELAGRYPFRGLPPGTVGIVERRAGYLSPDRLRAGVLARVRAAVHDVAVAGVTSAPAVRLPDGAERRFDAVVVAAGAWSARLLAVAGMPPGGLRTKRIQYSVHAGCPAGLGAFVDETSGLYGRPTGDGGMLVGLPSDEWDVDPGACAPDRALADRVAGGVRTRFATPAGAAAAVQTVASFDCYADPPGLALRPAAAGSALFSFTGGSGGAAKTVLAASRRAAHDLFRLCGRPAPSCRVPAWPGQAPPAQEPPFVP